MRLRGGYTLGLFLQALKDSLIKFDPRVQIRNPVMFVVWVGTLVTLALTDPAGSVRSVRRLAAL